MKLIFIYGAPAVGKLTVMMEKCNLTTAYPDKEGLTIDTTASSPKETAERIINLLKAF